MKNLESPTMSSVPGFTASHDSEWFEFRAVGHTSPEAALSSPAAPYIRRPPQVSSRPRWIRPAARPDLLRCLLRACRPRRLPPRARRAPTAVSSYLLPPSTTQDMRGSTTAPWDHVRG